MKNIFKLIISIAIPLAVGAISGYFTQSSVTTWFVTLNKPSFNPPSWVFAPVWTTLYIMMGIAFYIIWKSHAKLEKRYTGYTYYWLQLAANFLWSFLFFYYRQPGWALIDIVLMFILISCTIISFRKVSKTAAWLLVPYLCWVTFATALNFEIWRLN
ncbi:TspO/MBR family protein [Ferruginibacter yonginensis]|uniref:TspO/MBR family protein n=1 Tax=Ferruginibacter yonginensis TaxID=1310416 RepID=A0ABV8QQS4_9BACT